MIVRKGEGFRIVFCEQDSGLLTQGAESEYTTSSAKPIPDGFHTLTPHIVCRTAGKAIAFYERAFGAKELGRSLMPDGKSIMHALLKFGNSHLMLADEFPEWKLLGPQSKMPPMDMFWGDRYGQVIDPFGHIWAIATHIKDLSPAEIDKGARETMSKMCE